jgi:hypothetical protein
MPWLMVSTALTIFFDHMIDNMVVVNVNGGPEFTFLGVVSFDTVSLLSITVVLNSNLCEQFSSVLVFCFISGQVQKY